MPGFGYIVFLMFLVWFAWLPLLLIITLLTPRNLLEKYFKPPHFNTGEILVMGSFPGFFIRTALFGRLFLTPKAVKGRKLEGFIEDSPKWYRLSVMIFTIGFVSHFLFVFISMLAMYIYDHLAL